MSESLNAIITEPKKRIWEKRSIVRRVAQSGATMGWEKRGNATTKRYYYRARRIDGRIVKTYCGNGSNALGAAAEDAQAKAKRDATRAVCERLEASCRYATSCTWELEAGVKMLVEASLRAAGFHQHARTWRKRRMSNATMAANPADEPTKTSPASAVEITPLQATLELARRGVVDVLPRLREALNDHAGLWEHYGNLAQQAQASWLELIAGKNLLLKESAAHFAAVQRATLAGPDASPLEKLQIERIVAVGLQVSYFEAMIAQQDRKGADKLVADLERRRDAADRRLQEAITTLARVRKLLPRPIKVEVAVSGKVEATVKTRRSRKKTTRAAESGLPKNRLRDVLAASTSNN